RPVPDGLRAVAGGLIGAPPRRGGRGQGAGDPPRLRRPGAAPGEEQLRQDRRQRRRAHQEPRRPRLRRGALQLGQPPRLKVRLKVPKTLRASRRARRLGRRCWAQVPPGAGAKDLQGKQASTPSWAQVLGAGAKDLQSNPASLVGTKRDGALRLRRGRRSYWCRRPVWARPGGG